MWPDFMPIQVVYAKLLKTIGNKITNPGIDQNAIGAGFYMQQFVSN